LGGGVGWGILKDTILTSYLNNIYFWNNIYWVWAATEVYFWKQYLNDLTQEEITLLISLIHNPGIKSLEETSFRNYFTKIQNKLWYTFKRSIFKLNKKENIDKFPFVTNNSSRFLFPSPLGGGIKGGGLTIDSTLQQYAKDTLNKTLKWLKSKNVTNWAIFAINPKTKEILIYEWSRDFNSKEIDGQVDIIQSLRQPWSTMKPFLYLMALEKWANPDDLLLDLNNKLNSFQEWKTYISNNYSLNENWLVRFKKALWNSLNNASVRLASELWLNKVYEFYKQYGFILDKSADYYGYSLVLWNPSIKLEDLVRSYSKLLPDMQPLSLDKGRELGFSHPVDKWEVDIEQAKFLLYDILSNPNNRDISFWVNSVLNTSIYQAVKTWTSTDFRDNVIVSYHPDFVMWIWIGNNDNSSMIGVTWITGAWYIWHNIIEKAIELWYIKDEKLEIPKWIVKWEYCLDKNCFRKELIYKKEKVDYSSKVLENHFSSKDLYEKLNNDELDRLKDFQMYLE
jgi:membrane carboxypeptidase/penicillin-binding protein PbpC